MDIANPPITVLNNNMLTENQARNLNGAVFRPTDDAYPKAQAGPYLQLLVTTTSKCLL